MQNLSLEAQIAAVSAAFDKSAKQAKYATMVAINKSLDNGAKPAVRREMQRVFDKPTAWVLNSLRSKYATDRNNPVATLALKDKNAEGKARTMVAPHVDTGARHFKAMEVRLSAMGFLPRGWNAVPGAEAVLDANGNMNRGQITQLLNALTTSGDGVTNTTAARLAKGNVKRGVYGFAYLVNRVGNDRGKHLPPGVYQRISTGFGSSLKPILIFVRRVSYKQRLDFYDVAKGAVATQFPVEFPLAFDNAMRTAFPTQAGGGL